MKGEKDETNYKKNVHNYVGDCDDCYNHTSTADTGCFMEKSVSKTFKIKSDQTYLCARMVIKVNKPCTVTVHPSDWTATPGICKGTKYTGNDIIKYTDSKYNIEKQTLDVTYKLKKGTYCIFVTDLYNKDKLTLTAKTSKENLKLVKTSLDILDDLGDDLG